MTSLTESEYGTSQKCSDASETSGGDGFTSSDDGDDEGMFFFFLPYNGVIRK